MLSYLRAPRLQMSHALPQFAIHSATFFLAHPIQVQKRLFYFRQHRRRKIAFRCRRTGIEGAGKTQHCVQIGFGGDAGFDCSGTKCLHISGNQLFVEREWRACCLLKRQVHINMPACQLFLQNLAQRHFEHIGIRRQPKVKIEKAVINGLHRETECRAAIELAFNLSEPGHGTNRSHCAGTPTRGLSTSMN